MQASEEQHWGCPFLQGKIMGLFSEAFGVNCWAYEKEIYIDKEELSNNFIEFSLEPSEKTIAAELEALRIKRMQEKERKLTEEVSKKTDELAFANAQLENYSKDLEKTVEKRTFQLKETIEEINQINEELETQAEELKNQKHELERKNTTITESINYAKRIQKATLPSALQVKEHFPQSFVWYMPRDIVSGDFYWFELIKNAQNETEIVIAVGDCTGHGVSGCMMSMIGNNSLHQIVIEQKIHEPALILKNLDIRIRRLLKQDDENREIHDGMDLALCVFNPKTFVLRFASAKRPLWIFKSNQIQKEIKGNILPIGSSFYADKTFAEHEVRLEAQDRVYLFSDGVVDQFDNEDTKRLTTKRLRNILINLQKYPLEEQKTHLENAFYRWKGQTSQTDDLIFVAFEV